MPGIKLNTVSSHTALVVGASRGIGLALTRQLLNEPGDRNVYATYRQAGTVGGLLSIDDDRLQTLRVDITSAEDLQGLAETIRANGHHRQRSVAPVSSQREARKALHSGTERGALRLIM